MTADYFTGLRGDRETALPEFITEDRRQDKRGRFVGAIKSAETLEQKIRATAEWILTDFDSYYLQSRRVPGVAQSAFESRDAALSIELSHERISMYGRSVSALGNTLKRVFPEVGSVEALWDEIESLILPLIEGRYEADLAFAYFHSVRRMVYQGEWKPVDYSFRDSDPVLGSHTFKVHRTFPVSVPLETQAFVRILEAPGFDVPYRDIEEDAELLAARINSMLEEPDAQGHRVRSIEVVNAGFFRNRGCYIVGHIARSKHSPIPLIIAVLNSQEGLYVDAVLTREADAHNIFSSTLANFHVTNTRYHELSAFLHGIMPKRPLGLHYSTIGFNHVGKVAVMNELKAEVTARREVFMTAVGSPGTVAIGFSTPSSAYNLKVLRDSPTAGYKWGTYEGMASVLAKYGRVHEINRTGSMLDNIIYRNLQLDAAWFNRALLQELLEQAGESVTLRDGAVLLKYLIVQRRMTPLPVFLRQASEEDARTAIVNLGHCIKNNAAANIFNKDLDARNYGVSRLLKVYLFDYDALEPLTEVKVRSNAGMEDGEEDVPDWYFEEGYVFLPEEILAGLRIPDRELNRLFRAEHGDLLTTHYWEEMQRKLLRGEVPGIRVYPESERFIRDVPILGADGLQE